MALSDSCRFHRPHGAAGATQSAGRQHLACEMEVPPLHGYDLAESAVDSGEGGGAGARGEAVGDRDYARKRKDIQPRHINSGDVSLILQYDYRGCSTYNKPRRGHNHRVQGYD